MKTITINIAENGKAICSDTNLGRAGEHNNTTLHIVITDPAMTKCEFFRVWIGSRYSHKLTAAEGQIEYTLPQDALIPPTVDFQLCGYKMIECEPCLVVRSSLLSFEVSESAGCVMMSGNAYEPFEMINIECGASANAANIAMQRAREYAEQAGVHYEASCENTERIEAAAKAIGDAPKVTEEIVAAANAAANRAEAAAEELEGIFGDIDAALDSILAIQNNLLGGDAE